MEIRLISFSAKGCGKATEISETLSNFYNRECQAYALEKYIRDDNTIPLQCSLDEWTKKSFAESDAIIFVCACGIAVRAIAPYVKHKTEDPAVVVVDELGRYAIPILSGHLGGANRLAEEIAESIRAKSIVTTATDINGRFSVDTFAKENSLYITDMIKAKEISAAVLEGEKIGLICDYAIEGKVPDDLVLTDNPEKFSRIIYIGTGDFKSAYSLNLIPKLYVLGMGCKKGKSCKEIEELALKALGEAGLTMKDIDGVASIDLKKNEAGIKEFCKKYKLKSKFYTAEELSRVEGSFSSSEFVSSVTGIDNVCERAAAAASGGDLVLPKQSLSGVTVAIAKKDEEEMKISFE